MITKEQARLLRKVIEEQSENLSDETALTVKELFPLWTVGKNYVVNDRIRYLDKLYKVIQAHTSQEDWTPTVTPALYVEVTIEEIPIWKQPTGSHDTYMTGDKVYYPTKMDNIYISLIDYNVYAPDVYGWSIYEA